jgi:sec-independent protein translocase protein TatB
MLSNFGFGEIAVLALIAMLVFGPEKLPRAAMDAARVIKKLRSMADVAVNDFKSELPPDLANLDLRSLHPRRIVTDALFDSNRPDHETPDNPRPQSTAHDHI